MNPSTVPWGEKLRIAIIGCFHLLLFVVPLLWTATTSELFEFPKMMAVYALTILIAGLWFSRMIIEGNWLWQKTYLDVPLLLFLLSQAVSTAFSLDRHTSLWGYYSRFNGGLFSVICYLVLYRAAVANFTKGNLKHLLVTLMIGAGVASLYAFPEHFGHSPSCLKVTGNFDAKCWVQDVQTRVFGTFGQPNWLAAYLITLFFLPVAMFSILKKPFNLLSFILYPIYFSIILFTKSRSAFVGLALGFGIFWALRFFSAGSKITWLKRFSLNSVVLFLVFLLFGYGASPQTDRFFTLFSPAPSSPAAASPAPAAPTGGSQMEIGGTESGTIRKIVWQGAIALWQKYPLFGSGVETFAYGYYNVRPVAHNLVSEWDFLYNKAHNEFINYLATTGLFGLLAYLSIIFTFTIWAVKTIISCKGGKASERSDTHVNSGGVRARETVTPNDQMHIIISLIAGFWALQVSNFYGFSTVPVQLLFFLFPAFAWLLTQEQQPATRNPQPATTINTSKTIVLIIGLLVTGYLLQQIFIRYRADQIYAQGKRSVTAGDLGGALTALQRAALMVQNEPVYFDELSVTTAQAVALLAQKGDATQAGALTTQAKLFSDRAIRLNPAHPNFWKTRARVFVALTAYDPKYITPAEQALQTALKLAPTDAKLTYNLGVLAEQTNREADAQRLYEETITLKPNYEAARQSLAQIYLAHGDTANVREQYEYIVKHINPLNEVANAYLATASARPQSP